MKKIDRMKYETKIIKDQKRKMKLYSIKCQFLNSISFT